MSARRIVAIQTPTMTTTTFFSNGYRASSYNNDKLTENVTLPIRCILPQIIRPLVKELLGINSSCVKSFDISYEENSPANFDDDIVTVIEGKRGTGGKRP